ncbi:MAG: glycosyltransferase [Acidimicrobiales bacterium]|nr:glycosyltransferase [Acidimicrobiales bacterium]
MSAVFVLPVLESGRGAPVASMLSTAAWATAGARVFDGSWIVSPSGVLLPDEARRLATAPPHSGSDVESGSIRSSSPSTQASRSARSRVVGFVPSHVKTFAKDVRALVRGRTFRVGAGPWDDAGVGLVWQRHELYQDAGLVLADRLGVPSVLFAPATKVWEARRWGTNRPGWGRLTERFGEAVAIRRATLVTCGSEQVAEQVVRLGADPERVIVTPNGVDVERFGGGRRAEGLRLAGLKEERDRLLVGWVGSFRSFHGLDLLVDGLRGVADVHLLLVGDGPERRRIERRCNDAGVPVTATGTITQQDLPDLLAAMDVAVVVADEADTFHYSPLKLGEYLAAGCAVIAPDVGPVSVRAGDGDGMLLVPPGDAAALGEAVALLRDDPARRRALGEAGRELADATFSWDSQLRRIGRHLGLDSEPPTYKAVPG